MSNKYVTYKESLEEIENIIQKIESGEPDIDELSALVKRAATLIKECKKKLRRTEEDLSQTLGELED
ncbi:hypothetical protein C900_02549 [Fulvivirga imtechensis AK7]|uniref:Exodeoxyribonuclease VII small subunit n=1 Tax=Fulvivirga imtechensis AK7 TaxID=1237149 RepID=L8JR84_9BACT|nr:exodeoxyribonuclease VII small subunit [Fulvivirga imtechensis]ELR71486.1 hypothetical protein C900_02549 [Fulvivirga imtechensis AK7]